MSKQTINWVESPITKRMMVMQEFDDKHGVSKMDISTGYFTNEFPMNHKKNGLDKITEYESTMPESIKRLRFDDGESIWYPSTLQTTKEVIFPSGDTYENVSWHFAKLKDNKEIDSNTVVDCDTYLEAAKLVNGHSISVQF